MIVVSEARSMIKNGYTFAKMVHPCNQKDVIYWLKDPGRDGFEIPRRVGTYLEKSGTKPEQWQWDP